MKTTKSRIIIFAITITYRLLLGLYLKDFLVLSQTLTAFYLLPVLPTLFLLIEAHARAMAAIVYIVLVLDIPMNLIYFICCRRLLPVMTMVSLVAELMYFILCWSTIKIEQRPNSVAAFVAYIQFSAITTIWSCSPKVIISSLLGFTTTLVLVLPICL